MAAEFRHERPALYSMMRSFLHEALKDPPPEMTDPGPKLAEQLVGWLDRPSRNALQQP